MMEGELYLVWKVPKDRDIDVGDFHDIGIYPTGELMFICASEQEADTIIKQLQDLNSEEFGDDPPYTFTCSSRRV